MLSGLCLFFTYGVSFGPLEVGYKATRVFDSGWMEYFGGQARYWVLFNLGMANQCFQYNNLNVFLGFLLCELSVCCFFLIY